MGASEIRRETSLLLGRDYPVFGSYELRVQADQRSACAITVGSDPDTPARLTKGDPTVPNEDAVLLIDEGPRTLLAVADSHYGHEASHELLAALSTINPIPTNPLELFEAILATSDLAGFVPPACETTLLAAVVARDDNTGFAVSYGDSTLLIVGSETEPMPLNRLDQNYVTPTARESLAPSLAHEVHFRAGPGDLVVVFTDGIDHCHRGNPDTSVRAHHHAEIQARTRGAAQYVRELLELAMAGVDGNPGGQDNIAVAATTA